MPVTMVIYAVTAYRGPFLNYATGERLGMSIIIAILIFISLIIAQMMAMMIACIPTWIEVIETLKQQHDAIRAAQDAASSASP